MNQISATKGNSRFALSPNIGPRVFFNDTIHQEVNDFSQESMKVPAKPAIRVCFDGGAPELADVKTAG